MENTFRSTDFPAMADWFDDSPMGETYGVRIESEVICYTSRYKTGWDDAVKIADAWNGLQSDVSSVSWIRETGLDANVGVERGIGRQRLEHRARG